MNKKLENLIADHTVMTGIPFKTLLKRATPLKKIILKECNKSTDLLENLYLIKTNSKEIPKCLICNKNLKFTNYSKGYLNKTCSRKCGFILASTTNKKVILKKHGVSNISKLPEIKEKKKKSYLKSLGVDNPSKSKKVIDSKKENCLIKHGVENWNQLPEIKEKIKFTHLKKYGVTNPMKLKCISEKARQTSISKYGEKARLKGGSIRLKTEKTNIKKYGFHTPSMNKIIKQKIIDSFNENSLNSYLYKEYSLPSGKLVKIQGYENLYLDDYFKNGGLENNIVINLKEIINKIGLIKYQDADVIRKYYPDFYLINENKIIEVKSPYTFEKRKRINLLKEQAVLAKGIAFEFVFYNNKKKRLFKYINKTK